MTIQFLSNLENSQKIYKSLMAVCIALSLLSFALVFWYFLTAQSSGDDLNYYVKQNLTLDWIINQRYLSWSSRIFLESFIPAFVKHLWIFKLLVLALLALSPYLFSLLFNTDRNFKRRLFIIPLCAIVFTPFYEMETAGLVATTGSYFIPFVFALYPLLMLFSDRKLKYYEYILLFICTLICCNHEQSCAVIFCISFFCTSYSLFKKQVKPTAVFIFVTSLISLAFIALCPGNALRVQAEASIWMPEFLEFSLYDKIFLGLSTTLYALCYNNYMPYLFCILAMILCVTNRIYAVVIAFGVIGFLRSFVKSGFIASDLTEGPQWLESFSYLNLLILFIMYCVLCGCVLFTRMEFKYRLILLLLIVLAAAVRCVMGFSPTVFASGVRPQIFSQIILCICALFALYKSDISENKCLLLCGYFLFYNLNKYIIGYLV